MKKPFISNLSSLKIILRLAGQLVEMLRRTYFLTQVRVRLQGRFSERTESAELLKDAYNEAKSLGFDVKIIKHVLKLKKKDKDQLAEEDNLIDLYRGALG